MKQTMPEQWFSISNLLDMMKENSPKWARRNFGAQSRRLQMQTVRRLVDRHMTRNETPAHLRKKVGKEILVHSLVLDQILRRSVAARSDDDERSDELERELSNLSFNVDQQNTKIRKLENRIKKLEQILALIPLSSIPVQKL